jgi:hypothetical protein
MPFDQQPDLFGGTAHAPPPRESPPPPRQPRQPALPELDGEQLAAADAVRAFLAASEGPRYFTVHGLAGTGKTVLLATLVRELPGATLAAPTGKAAAVLARKAGWPASTLHRLLYAPQETADGRLRFVKLREPGALAGSVALVDEASMINAELANDLLETGLRIVAFGDPGQLPPVNGEQFFGAADVTLTQIRRQAADSGIIRQAHAVRAGLPYADDGDAFRIVARADIPAAIDSADIVLCWTNALRHRINRYIRERRGIPAAALPRAGEPLICLENRAGLLNGEMATVAADYAVHDNGEGELLLAGLPPVRQPWFEWLEPDGKRWPRGATPFGLGYCITVHKAQGSEWPMVAVADDFAGDTDRERWLYTAVTRASEAVRIWPTRLQ